MQLKGVVVHGKQEARTLGHPTANIEYTASTLPRSGVWTCCMVVKEKTHQGLAIVGMWNLSNGEPSVEVHLLDFHQDIYGEKIEVSLKGYLRPLEKFETVKALKQQIEKDIHRGRAWFHKNTSKV